MKKDDIIQLIEKWDDFSQQNEEGDLENFAIWLLQKEAMNEKRAEIERTAAYLLSRVERYSKANIKNLFSDLPLIAYEDFILLNTVFHQPNIPKKELYEQNIYDMNSGTQVINRLKREGLVEDFQSETDRRVFLLKITEAGKKVRNIAFERLGEECHRKFSAVLDDELKQFLSILEKIEGNQRMIYS